MHRNAQERGGKCLSKEYINARTKLTWECKKGHVWEATPDNIRRSKWCPTCASKRLTIEEMHRNAEERGGKCLSEKYVNAKTKLKWECKEGHIWEAKPASVRRGKWCPYCSGRLK